MEVVDLRELALKKVKILGNIIGKFGTFEIEQNFKNNKKDVLEVGYTFPIVETATVVGFEIKIGDKLLKGVCKENGKAKEEYQRNIVQGNSAYLMEQYTSNTFKISVGKIDVNEEVTVKIKYIDKFEIIDNNIQILIPTLVAPKYKSTITNKLVYGKTNYTIDFNINIDKSLNRKIIRCPSHTINVVDENKTERVEVQDYDLSKDFKLNIELKKELSSNGIVSKTKDGNDIVYLAFMPEILESFEDNEKEYLFLIDVSGSMQGRKLDQTKKAVIECLKQLDFGDKFNIIQFETRYTAMSITSVEYNEDSLNMAIKYVNSLEAKGGTEILSPIKFALYEKETDKTILLYTDGQVGNESEIIKYVENNISKSRIFPFGIDTNVNSAFIKSLAKVGNGKAELIQPNEKIDDKIIRTFARIQTPLLEKLTIDYGTNKVLDEIKEDNNLFNYEFFNVFTEIEELKDDIVLKGKINNKEYSWTVSKDVIQSTTTDLEVLFAKQKIDRLEDYIRMTLDMKKISNYKKMIIELSERYNINSKYTSFITVYERDNKIFDVPKYEETVLSGKHVQGVSMARAGLTRKSNFGYVANAKYSVMLINDDITRETKTNEEILKDKVDEYYNSSVLQGKSSILTLVLFALYYLNINRTNFKHDKLFSLIENKKEEITKNEIYMSILCLCYNLMAHYSQMDRERIINLLNNDFRKIAETNYKLEIKFNELPTTKVKEIICKDKVSENIDEILEHLIRKRWFYV